MQEHVYQTLYHLLKHTFKSNFMAKNLLTFNGLTNKLDEELGWRRKELFLIKSKIPKDENSLQAVLLRSAIPFLYAHWEGYIKVVLSSYLQYVSNKHLKHNELKYPFVALSLQNKVGQLDINNIILLICLY